MAEGSFPGINRPLFNGYASSGKSHPRFSFRTQSDSAPTTSTSDENINTENRSRLAFPVRLIGDARAASELGATALDPQSQGYHHVPTQSIWPALGEKSLARVVPDPGAPSARRQAYPDSTHTSSNIALVPGQYSLIAGRGSVDPILVKSVGDRRTSSGTGIVKTEHGEDTPDPASVDIRAPADLAPSEVGSDGWGYTNRPDHGSTAGRAIPTSFPRASAGPHARAPSELSFNDQDDDISTVMMRGATDLRNAKIEREELRRQVTEMEQQLQRSRNEKNDIERRWKEFRQNSLASLESSRQSIAQLQSVMEGLQSRSEDAFGFARTAKSSLPELADLRTTVADALQRIEPSIDDDGELVRASKTRDIIKDLQAQNTHTQQVVDLLRDKLTSSGSDLIQARTRIRELEETHQGDREALCRSADAMREMTSRLSDMSTRLRDQGSELVDALVSAANNEKDLMQLQQRVDQLSDDLARSNEELEGTDALKGRNADLQRQLDNQRLELQSLELAHTELRSHAEQLRQREADVTSLTCSLKAEQSTSASLHNKLSELEKQLLHESTKLKDTSIELAEVRTRSELASSAADELRDKVVTCQRDFNAQGQNLHALQVALAETQARSEGLKSEKESLHSENISLKQTIQKLETCLEEKGKELDGCKEKLHDALTQSQILQERFDDQSVTLRITKESNGDLQERLITAEVSYAQKLEATTSTAAADIRVLQEQKSHMDLQLKEAAAELRSVRENGVKELADMQVELRRVQERAELKLKAESERASQMAHAHIEAMKSRQELREDMHVLELKYQNLLREAERAEQLSLQREEVIKDLEVRLRNLDSCKAALEERAKTIASRYSLGNLSEEEKAFLGNLTRTTESFYEQELIAKGNELRKRENALKALQARNKLLESTLARHLNSQARAQAQAGNESRSMIDLDQWLSSQMSSSPAHVQAQVTFTKAPDRDVPSTNNDDIGTNSRTTPAPRRAVLPPTGSSPPASDVYYQHPGPAAVRYTPKATNTAMLPPTSIVAHHRVANGRIAVDAASGATLPMSHHTTALSRTTFTSLATDGSDEIVDFDDDRRISPGISSKTPPPPVETEIAGSSAAERGEPPMSSRSLRKRDRTVSPAPSGNGRPKRRTKVAGRKSVRQDSVGEKRKGVEPQAALRAKTRKRR